ncbi:MAG: family 16 glycosylhydrolase [Sedimentisphaeraceae bacterium JB056]
MNKNLMVLITLLAAFQMAYATQIDWDNGDAYDSLWSSSDNWYGNVIPSSSDYAYIIAGQEAADPTINSSVPTLLRVYVGKDGTGDATLTVNSGASITITEILRLGHYSSTSSDVHGILDMTGGTITIGSSGYIDVGDWNTDGTLNISGGTINTDTLYVPGYLNSTGTVNVDGGEINIGSGGLVIVNDEATSSVGQVDISGGTIVIDGDVTSTIQSYIDNDYITAYNGSGAVSVDYNVTNSGKTTLYAVKIYPNWRDRVEDHLWSNPNNWDGYIVPVELSNMVFIKAGLLSSPKQDPIINTTVPDVFRIGVGKDGSGTATLTITSSASITVTDLLRLGNYNASPSTVHGILNMSGGTLNVGTTGTYKSIDVGSKYSTGTLNLSGGTINVNTLNVPHSSFSTGEVNVSGGTLNVGTGGVFLSNDPTTGIEKAGSIDICGGTLIIDGQWQGRCEIWAANGWLTAYDGDGILNIDYDVTNSGKTTVTATFDEGKARKPSPIYDGIGLNPTLSWEAGDYAAATQGHDVYFGTSYTAVLNATTSSGEYMGRFDPNSWTPSTLDYATTYYWRVDEINTTNVQSPWTGYVWNFTTTVDLPEKTGWTLTFHDEFNGTGMDWTKWESSSASPSHILSSRWPENIVVNGGCMNMLTIKENRGDAQWTTGDVWTRSFKQKYGYWEARYKYAAETGLNNAFWVYAPGDFEIDINEGHYTGEINTNLHNWDGTHIAYGQAYNTGLDLSAAFHTYALEWTDTELKYYFDGQLIRTLNHTTTAADPNDPTPAQFSSAVHEWAGDITDDLDGKNMVVDYVRVYERSKQAYNPTPTDGEIAVSSSTALSWTAGAMAAATNGHDVYLGTSEQAVAVADHNSDEFQGTQSTTTFSPSSLNQGTTYYWAIDEINGNDIWPGNIWSFTTWGPSIYLIDPSNITATASGTSQYGYRSPVYAINGNGLTDQNHTNGNGDYSMWMDDTSTGWFKVDLGSSYSLGTLKLWNFNMDGYTDRGVNQADVYYSNSASDPGNPVDNPSNWTLVGTAGSQTFTEASGRSDYGSNTSYSMPDIVNLYGITARWISLDINSNHGSAYLGISELQVTEEPDPIYVASSNITSSASGVSQWGDREDEYAIDGSGISGNAHTNSIDGYMWMADTSTGWYKVDLGQEYSNLYYLKIWNFNYTGYTGRGANQVDIYYSNNASDPGDPANNPSNWTLIGTQGSLNLTEASGRSDYGSNSSYNMPDIIDLTNITARWFYLDINSNHGIEPYIGLSEMKFYKY